jgi:hypothetical protein
MPVDFTKDTKKTNVQYLRELITVGHEERIEFLESIETELVKKDERILELEGELADAVDTEEKESAEAEYTDVIDTKMGNNESIRFSAPNLACQTMMDELESAIDRGVSLLKIENVLRAL